MANVFGSRGPNARFAPGGASAISRPVALKLRDQVSIADYVRDFTGTTDESVAVQAWIDDLKAVPSALGRSKKLGLGVPGLVRATNILINRPVNIQGNDLELFTANGSTAPVIRVAMAHDGTDYFANGGLAAELNLVDLRVRGQSRIDAPGVGNVHGIKFEDALTNPIYTRARMTNVRVNGVPGSSFWATGWHGLVEAYGCISAYPGEHGVLANSVADWRWFGGENFGAIQDNWLLSGAFAFEVFGCYTYVAGRYNLNAYGSTRARFACYFDIAKQHNVMVNLFASGLLDLSGSNLRWASQQTDNTYSDVYLEAASSGYLRLNGNTFEAPAANPFAPYYGPKWNVERKAGNTTTVLHDKTNVFLAGNVNTARVTNDVSMFA